MPIPLVAPAALKLKILSAAPLPAVLIAAVLAPMSAPEPVAAPTVLPPTVPPALTPFLVYAAPNLFPSACSKLDVASTIKASIKTCFVLTSISLMTLSTTSKSFSFPLTIIDLVVFSSVI